MRKAFILLLLFIWVSSCKAQDEPTEFSQEALADSFTDLDGNSITFSQILETYKGKQIVIDIWASWCKDCILSMPKIKQLQQNNKDTVFLFLSLDKNNKAWKKGIEKYKLKGEHYYMKSGWKGDFATFLDLDWIPRYIVVDKTSKIMVFRAIKVDDNKLETTLEI